MTLEEVERRLRDGYPASASAQRRLADAIRAHREHLEDLADRWERDFNSTLYRADCAKELRALLPPQKSALQRAIEMVEMARPLGPPMIYDLLALLREAEKEAANGS